MFNIVLFSAGLFLSLRCHRYRCCPFTLQRKSSWYRTLEIRTKECKSLYISNITHTNHPYFCNIKLHTHHRLRNDHICTFVPCQRVGTLALTGLFWYTLLATLLKELSKQAPTLHYVPTIMDYTFAPWSLAVRKKHIDDSTRKGTAGQPWRLFSFQAKRKTNDGGMNISKYMRACITPTSNYLY